MSHIPLLSLLFLLEPIAPLASVLPFISTKQRLIPIHPWLPPARGPEGAL